jgi:hypothetical protein
MIKILISSNCQTGGIAAALKEIFPSFEVSAKPLPTENDIEGIDQLKTLINANDIWVTADTKLFDLDISGFKNKKIIKIPEIIFPAFHPDSCYVVNKETKKNSPFYHSKIIAWAFKNNIDKKNLPTLFNDSIYSKLGYYLTWNSSVSRLKNRFDNSDLKNDFHNFMLASKRIGPFMHSVNHPKSSCLVILAKLIAKKIMIDCENLYWLIEIPDGLIGSSYPLFPEVASQLGIGAGSYRWIANGVGYHSVSLFADFCYKYYEDENFNCTNMQINELNNGQDEVVFGRILNSILVTI